jgi:hypothetical protein
VVRAIILNLAGVQIKIDNVEIFRGSTLHISASYMNLCHSYIPSNSKPVSIPLKFIPVLLIIYDTFCSCFLHYHKVIELQNELYLLKYLMDPSLTNIKYALQVLGC